VCRSVRRGDDVQFSEFVRYIIDASNSLNPNRHRHSPRDDFHWRPMSEACLPCHINYTLVGRFETLAQDAARVLRAVGVAGRVQFPLAVEAREPGDKMRGRSVAGNRTRRMFAQLAPDDVERLRQLYRDDFELFAYDPYAY